jgi:hypothetical protein
MQRDFDEYDFWGDTGHTGGGPTGPVIGGYDPGNGPGNVPPPVTSQVGDSAAGTGGGDTGGFSYTPPRYTGSDRPEFNFPDVPVFNAPEFVAPTGESLWSDPGYQFRLSQGQKALEQSQAARGLLRTGGSIKGFEDYTQNSASQEYQSAFNRALEGYDRQYAAARDEFAPQLAAYSNQFGAEQQAGTLAFQQEWDRYAEMQRDELMREQLLEQAARDAEAGSLNG